MADNRRVDFKDLRQRADFRAILAHYSLKPVGNGDQLKIRWPFHDDHEPSCSVNLTKRAFHCFGCGIEGNVLDFVHRLETRGQRCRHDPTALGEIGVGRIQVRTKPSCWYALTHPGKSAVTGGNFARVPFRSRPSAPSSAAVRTGVAPRALARLFRRAGGCPVRRPIDSARMSRASLSTTQAGSSGSEEGHADQSQRRPSRAEEGRRRPRSPTRFKQPLQPSKELAAVVGTGPLARGEVVSKVWDYIKKHDLQNPENRREILADDKLEAVFGKKKVTMFEMNKYLAQHLK